MRFVEYLPIIKEKLPVCPDGTDLSISYYLFNKGTSADNPTGNKFPIIHYAHEAAYAYKQLIELTNIMECGRVRFFMDKHAEPQMMPYFEEIGLESLVVPIEVPTGVRLSGYIPQLFHECLDPCRYRFHNDTDLWWIAPGGVEVFDWHGFRELLETASDDAVYGQPIEKPEWVYQVNLSQHALSHDAQERAGKTLHKIFGPRIPDEFADIAEIDNEKLRERRRLSPLRCLGGWFVGIDSNNNASWYLKDLYEKHEDILSDDEGLYALLFHLHPYLEQFQVLQGHHPPVENQIQQTSLLNFGELDVAGMINVGVQQFYMDKHQNDRILLAEFILGEPHSFEDTKSVIVPDGDDLVEGEMREMSLSGGDLIIPANCLRIFGKHIVGTYALDESSHVYPLLSHTDCNNGALLSLPASFMPITSPLAISETPEPELAVFFCLFSSVGTSMHDLHVYAKSLTYAIKMLNQNTNIFDVGQVFCFIDKRIMSVVYPYMLEANLQSLVVPFDSNKDVHYAAYIPHFWHEVMEDIPIRLYMDVDMWWINLDNDEKFDYGKLVEEFTKHDKSVFGNSVPKRSEWVYADIYERCIDGGDHHIVDAKRWMNERFGSDVPSDDVEIRAITGSQNGIHTGLSLDKLKVFYENVGNFILDDEAFWTLFLTCHPEIVIKQMSEAVPGMNFSSQAAEHHKGSELAHVGTYMFEHFFGKPLAEKFYHHVSSAE